MTTCSGTNCKQQGRVTVRSESQRKELAPHSGGRSNLFVRKETMASPLSPAFQLREGLWEQPKPQLSTKD